MLSFDREPTPVYVNSIAALLALTSAMTACGRGAVDRDATFRDSAGVTIVESTHPAWTEYGRWHVADAPFLDIGSADGSPEYQFHRIEGVVRMRGGGVAVADGGSGEVRFFDDQGQFLSASGGAGDAPGEYRMISAIGVGPGDSLWVFDYGNRRFTVLNEDGVPQRTVSVGGFLSAAGAVGRIPNGSFVVKEGWGRATGGSRHTGLARDPVAVAIVSPDGSSFDTLGMFPGREVFISIEDGRAVMSAPLFAHNTSAVIRDSEVFVGVQEEMEIGLYASDGKLRQIFRIRGVDLDLGAPEIAARRREALARVPEERRPQAADQLDRLAVPDARPAYGRLLVAVDGSLWAAEQVRYPAIARTWTVFAADGRLLGEVVMPERFRLHQVGDDWVLGVGLDEVDVEHVLLYRLTK